MNKVDLANAMASDAGINQSQAQAALNSALTNIESALVNGDKVALAGFGNFDVAERSARTGRNPRTGEEIQIAAKRVAKFRPAKALSDAVNQ